MDVRETDKPIMVPKEASSPFHRGEQLVQEKLGVRDIEDWARKVVRDHLPEQHREFYASLPFLVVAARDDQGKPWATLLAGPDGFATSPHIRHLQINAKLAPGDALESSFSEGAEMGILGIELATRRRNRVNGRVTAFGPDGITFRVDQSFGNCPQYIREREWRRVDNNSPGRPVRVPQLSSRQREWIAGADTFFIATGYRGDGESPAFGMDASHRGGERGFVEVLSDRRIRFPDYAGNNHFNTVGNLLLDPQAGFLFIDFSTGSLLQLTGQAAIDWNSREVSRFPGARRLITLDIEEAIEIPNAVALRWDEDAESVRSLRLVEKIQESDDVTSFVFEARDGGPLAGFEPGQHLPIELNVPGIVGAVRRTYSISSGPGDPRYRISVKRVPNGLASNYLHDQVAPGAIIDSRRPAGEFMMTCNICPLVLVSAGVGITPMISILRAVADEGGDRPVWFVHGARNGRHHPLAAEVRTLAEKRSNIVTHVSYSEPKSEDKMGADYDRDGRVTGALLAELVRGADAHYFLCGPTSFMAEIQADLEEQGVAGEQVHAETFGPK
jgi:uncharacterized protein